MRKLMLLMVLVVVGCGKAGSVPAPEREAERAKARNIAVTKTYVLASASNCEVTKSFPETSLLSVVTDPLHCTLHGPYSDDTAILYCDNGAFPSPPTVCEWP